MRICCATSAWCWSRRPRQRADRLALSGSMHRVLRCIAESADRGPPGLDPLALLCRQVAPHGRVEIADGECQRQDLQRLQARLSQREFDFFPQTDREVDALQGDLAHQLLHAQRGGVDPEAQLLQRLDGGLHFHARPDENLFLRPAAQAAPVPFETRLGALHPDELDPRHAPVRIDGAPFHRDPEPLLIAWRGRSQRRVHALTVKHGPAAPDRIAVQLDVQPGLAACVHQQTLGHAFVREIAVEMGRHREVGDADTPGSRRQLRDGVGPLRARPQP